MAHKADTLLLALKVMPGPTDRRTHPSEIGEAGFDLRSQFIVHYAHPSCYRRVWPDMQEPPPSSRPAHCVVTRAFYNDARKPRDGSGTVSEHVRQTLALKRRSG